MARHLDVKHVCRVGRRKPCPHITRRETHIRPEGSSGLLPSDGDGRLDVHAEAARHIELSIRKLYAAIDEGQIPAYKFGRVIRPRVNDVLGHKSGGWVCTVCAPSSNDIPGIAGVYLATTATEKPKM